MNLIAMISIKLYFIRGVADSRIVLLLTDSCKASQFFHKLLGSQRLV